MFGLIMCTILSYMSYSLMEYEDIARTFQDPIIPCRSLFETPGFVYTQFDIDIYC